MATTTEASWSFPDFSGHLRRQGKRGQWRHQYFVLQGTHLFWFAPGGNSRVSPPKAPKGHIWLDSAFVEPITIGNLSDAKALGRLPMAVCDAPPGVPPWGLAVEARQDAAAGGGGSPRLIVSADSQELRDLWLGALQHAASGAEPPYLSDQDGRLGSADSNSTTASGAVNIAHTTWPRNQPQGGPPHRLSNATQPHNTPTPFGAAHAAAHIQLPPGYQAPGAHPAYSQGAPPMKPGEDRHGYASDRTSPYSSDPGGDRLSPRQGQAGGGMAGSQGPYAGYEGGPDKARLVGLPPMAAPPPGPYAGTDRPTPLHPQQKAALAGSSPTSPPKGTPGFFSRMFQCFSSSSSPTRSVVLYSPGPSPPRGKGQAGGRGQPMSGSSGWSPRPDSPRSPLAHGGYDPQAVTFGGFAAPFGPGEGTPATPSAARAAAGGFGPLQEGAGSGRISMSQWCHPETIREEDEEGPEGQGAGWGGQREGYGPRVSPGDVRLQQRTTGVAAPGGGRSTGLPVSLAALAGQHAHPQLVTQAGPGPSGNANVQKWLSSADAASGGDGSGTSGLSASGYSEVSDKGWGAGDNLKSPLPQHDLPAMPLDSPPSPSRSSPYGSFTQGPPSSRAAGPGAQDPGGATGPTTWYRVPSALEGSSVAGSVLLDEFGNLKQSMTRLQSEVDALQNHSHRSVAKMQEAITTLQANRSQRRLMSRDGGSPPTSVVGGSWRS